MRFGIEIAEGSVCRNDLYRIGLFSELAVLVLHIGEGNDRRVLRLDL